MNKKNIIHLITAIICACVVIGTLVFLHDEFVFHTYGNVIEYDDLLSGENDVFTISGLEVYKDEGRATLSNGTITFKDPASINGGVSLSVVVTNSKSEEFTYPYSIEFNNATATYSLTNQDIDKKIEDIKTVKADLMIDNNVVSTIDALTIEPMVQLIGGNAEYRLERASYLGNLMKLGTLKTADDKVINEYPNISLEYRYVKDETKDKSDNDNYVVFKKITGNTSEFINGQDFGTYILGSENDGVIVPISEDEMTFDDKDLSVVVILSNDSDRFVFIIELNRNAGDTNG